ncbi:MAG: 2-amino-4-hydroxy-6-hydroxymethyldihydropteridine diphosphokinase [Bacteroidales bacterium]|mgnify:CR=1 FL=1|nr:2-amino-4-hydroxy-6-hydroxymethyldihydropteridine diphosphokinase [Bacteroidales bacterium]
MFKAVLSLGSNKGNRAFYMNEAALMIESQCGTIIRKSPVIETKSWGYDSHDYLNQVLEIQTELEPLELLKVTKNIEFQLGRSPESKTPYGTQDYQDRTMDIDILYFDQIQMNTEELTLPHPRIQERQFILYLLDSLK